MYRTGIMAALLFIQFRSLVFDPDGMEFKFVVYPIPIKHVQDAAEISHGQREWVS
jgi:hypothetical protein